jgi:peptidoglycan/LPS O-acetylase OafA/YrhL
MGIVRLLLAVSVVVMHCDGGLSQWVLVGGGFAVKLFFIVSGFYMAMVLTEKYHQPNLVGVFYTNRLLRLLPTYYLILGASLAVPLVAGLIAGRPISIGEFGVWRKYGDQLPNGMATLLRAIQLSPVGQEFGFMANLDPAASQIYFGEPSKGSLALFNFLLIPPAWSISLELQFYAIAPWLVRRSSGLLLTIAALSTSLYFILPRIPVRPLGFLCHHSLLTEISFFVLGIFAYRFLGWIRSRPDPSRLHRLAPLIHAVGLAVLFAYPWLGPAWRDPAVALTFAACIPWIFLNTARTRWDRAIGELSYPFYLVHWLVLRLGFAVLSTERAQNLPPVAVLGILTVASLLAAALLHRLVERPIDRYRQDRLRRTAA